MARDRVAASVRRAVPRTARPLTAPDRLLVRLPNALGDTLMARPLLHALRVAFPRAEIRAVVPRVQAALLASDGAFDLALAWSKEPGAGQTLEKDLRSWRPAMALVLPPSFSSAWFAWRTGAGVRIGYRGEARDFLLTLGLARPARGDRHLSEEYLELGRAVGVEPAPVPRYVPLPAANESAGALLARHADGARDYVVMGPAAEFGPAKRWAPERFAAVGRTLAAKGRRVLVCGTTGERDTCEAVAREIGPAAVSLAGHTDLTTLAALCAGAAVCVCNDSGLSHLSAAVGAPTVVVFGSTSSAWTAPLGARVRVVQDAPVCSPCFQRRCRIGTVCLEAVTADAVRAACAEVMA